MAKPEGWRLTRASYPFSAMTQTRFGDMDVLGHLNNVAYAAYFEHGRMRFNRSLVERSQMIPGERWLVAAVAINYVAEGHFPDDIDVASGIGHIGTSSWVIVQAAFQGDRCIATCDTTLVYQGADGKTKPLSDAFRTKLMQQQISVDRMSQ